MFRRRIEWITWEEKVYLPKADRRAGAAFTKEFLGIRKKERGVGRLLMQARALLALVNKKRQGIAGNNSGKYQQAWVLLPRQKELSKVHFLSGCRVTSCGGHPVRTEKWRAGELREIPVGHRKKGKVKRLTTQVRKNWAGGGGGSYPGDHHRVLGGLSAYRNPSRVGAGERGTRCVVDAAALLPRLRGCSVKSEKNV